MGTVSSTQMGSHVCVRKVSFEPERMKFALVGSNAKHLNRRERKSLPPASTIALLDGRRFYFCLAEKL